MRPIRSLKEYESRYKDYHKKLIVFSKKEVEDFDKFNNSVGEHALLKHRKWVFLEGSYYEIPRPIRWTWFRGLNAGVQFGTCVLLAGAVGGGAYGIYALVNNNKFDGRVTEEQWAKALDTIFTNNENRNFAVNFDNGEEHGIIKVNGNDFFYTELDEEGEPSDYFEYETRTNDGSLIDINNYDDGAYENYHIEYLYEIGNKDEAISYYLDDLNMLKETYSDFVFNSNNKTYEYKDDEISSTVKFNSDHRLEECTEISTDKNAKETNLYAKFSNYDKVDKIVCEKPDNYHECKFQNDIFISDEYSVEDNVSYQCFTIDFDKESFDFGDYTKIELVGDDSVSHINNNFERKEFTLNGVNFTVRATFDDSTNSYKIDNEYLDKNSKLTIFIDGYDESYTEGNLQLKVSQVSE